MSDTVSKRKYIDGCRILRVKRRGVREGGILVKIRGDDGKSKWRWYRLDSYLERVVRR